MNFREIFRRRRPWKETYLEVEPDPDPQIFPILLMVIVNLSETQYFAGTDSCTCSGFPKHYPAPITYLLIYLLSASL